MLRLDSWNMRRVVVVIWTCLVAVCLLLHTSTAMSLQEWHQRQQQKPDKRSYDLPAESLNTANKLEPGEQKQPWIPARLTRGCAGGSCNQGNLMGVWLRLLDSRRK